MSNHILTADGHLYHCDSTGDELYHYGVPGMKWGHRRAQKRIQRADRRIRKIEKTRAQNKLEYEEMKAESRDIYSGKKKAKKLAKSLAGDKAFYDTSETTNKYLIARQKAKKDKAYKNSAEYKQARTAYGKQHTQQVLFGTAGHHRIETLKNMGVSEKKAKVRTAVEQTLLAAGIMAAVGGIGYATRNR